MQKKTRHKIVVVGPYPLMDAKGGICAVITSYHHGGLFQSDDVLYIAASSLSSHISKGGVLLIALWHFFRAMTLGRARLAHIHAASWNSFYRKMLFVIIARLLRKQVILHLHGGEFSIFYSQAAQSQKWLIRRTLKAASLLLVLSDSWESVYRELCPNQTIQVLHNPVDTETFLSNAPSPRTPTKNIKLLFLGRLCYEKGFEDLLDALPQVLKQWPGTELFACGLGDLPKYRDKCKAMAIRNNVHFLGWVEHEQKVNLLGQADIFVLPSHNEGFPLCLLEAMAAGLPVVATNVGGIPDLVEPGKNGILTEAGQVVALANAITNLAEDFTLRERMSVNNRLKAIEQYDIKLIMRELFDLYHNLSGYYPDFFHPDSDGITEVVEVVPEIGATQKIL